MHQHRVAVRRRARHRSHADGGAATWTVFNHDGLAELLRQLIEHDAADDVVGVAGGERNDRGDGPARPRLRQRLMGTRPTTTRRPATQTGHRRKHVFLLVSCLRSCPRTRIQIFSRFPFTRY
jgi:hypothetical protein